MAFLSNPRKVRSNSEIRILFICIFPLGVTEILKNVNVVDKKTVIVMIGLPVIITQPFYRRREGRVTSSTCYTDT